MAMHRNGKKKRGGHTSVIGLAGEVYDLASSLREISGISPGHIKMGCGNGKRKVKIGCVEGKSLLLTIRSSHSVQKLRVFFAKDPHRAMLSLARTLRDNNIAIHFG